MPPVLASVPLGDPSTYEKIGWDLRFGLQQWWLRVSLARGSTPATALSGFRYGTLLTASYRCGNVFEIDNGDTPPAGKSATPHYSKMAQRFELVGSTMVTRTFDKAGNPAQASVSARDITMPGKPVFKMVWDL